MEPRISRLVEEAMQLPPEARAALAGFLLESLDDTLDQDREAAWELEIVERVKELDSLSVRLIPWSEARRSITGS